MTLRATSAADEEFLWLMLYYASHSNDEAGSQPDDVRVNPDLTGYISGWHTLGRPGVIAEAQSVPVGAAWLRAFHEADRSDPAFVDPQTPELAVAVLPGHEGNGLGTAMMLRLWDLVAGKFPAIVLSVRGESPAVRLYGRLGFEVVGTITNRVGTESKKMVLKLTP